MSSPSFAKTYIQFINELTLTFPEFSSALKIARDLEDAEVQFVRLWKPHTANAATQNGAMFTPEGVEVVPGFKLTTALWTELSIGTQSAIWKYISSLLLLAASETGKDEGFWDVSGFQHDMEEMMKALKMEGGGLGGGMGDIFEKLSKMAETFGFDSKDIGSGKFKLPERLFKGHIAKIAEELVKEFKPEDFGISPEMLESDDPAKIFMYLQEIFTKKPEMLMVSAQKIAKKIQAKFARGEIKREDIIREAEELMKEFSENDTFSSLFGSLGEMLKSGEKESGNEGSARRREVQERLRKKAADKAGRATSNVLVPDERAAADADASAAALLREEDDAASKKKSTKGKKK